MVKLCNCHECGTIYEAIDKFCPECGESKHEVIQIPEDKYMEMISDKD